MKYFSLYEIINTLYINNYKSTEPLDLFWTLSIVWYVEDKRPQRFGDWICLRPQVDGADPVSETLCFSLLFRKNPDDGQSPKTQYLCVLYTIVRTL
jgi:hypothetical protein